MNLKTIFLTVFFFSLSAMSLVERDAAIFCYNMSGKLTTGRIRVNVDQFQVTQSGALIIAGKKLNTHEKFFSGICGADVQYELVITCYPGSWLEYFPSNLPSIAEGCKE